MNFISTHQINQLIYLFLDRCIEDSLILLLNWQSDILSQMDLTEEERYHLREYLIYLFYISLQCVHFIFNKLSSSEFLSINQSIITVS